MKPKYEKAVPPKYETREKGKGDGNKRKKKSKRSAVDRS